MRFDLNCYRPGICAHAAWTGPTLLACLTAWYVLLVAGRIAEPVSPNWCRCAQAAWLDVSLEPTLQVFKLHLQRGCAAYMEARSYTTPDLMITTPKRRSARFVCNFSGSALPRHQRFTPSPHRIALTATSLLCLFPRRRPLAPCSAAPRAACGVSSAPAASTGEWGARPVAEQAEASSPSSVARVGAS
eukprot:3819366-Pleurochrysis_carterae.AAC.1